MKVLGRVRRNGRVIRFVGNVCELALQQVTPQESNDHMPRWLKQWVLGVLAIGMIITKTALIIAPIVLPQHSVYSSAITVANVLQLVNAERRALDLPVLVQSPQLSLAAKKKAEDMASKNYFAHTSPTGEGMRQFIYSTGYRYEMAGENLAMQFSEAEDIARAWMLSTKHRANITKSGYTETGIGIVESTSGTPQIYVVQYFAKPTTKNIAAALVETPKTQEPSFLITVTPTSTKASIHTPTSTRIVLPADTDAEIFMSSTTQVTSTLWVMSGHSVQDLPEQVSLIQEENQPNLVALPRITTQEPAQFLAEQAQTHRGIRLGYWEFAVQDINDAAERVYMTIIAILIGLLLILAVMKVEMLRPKLITQIYTVVFIGFLAVLL